MRIRTKNHLKSGLFRRRCDDPLKLAVRLALSQLSQGIGLAEAVQFAAKYHNVTCSAIDAALLRKELVFDKGARLTLARRPSGTGQAHQTEELRKP